MTKFDRAHNTAQKILRDFQQRRYPGEMWFALNAGYESREACLDIISQIIKQSPLLPRIRVLDPRRLWPDAAIPPDAGIDTFVFVFGAKRFRDAVLSWVKACPAMGEPGSALQHPLYEMLAYLHSEENHR